MTDSERVSLATPAQIIDLYLRRYGKGARLDYKQDSPCIIVHGKQIDLYDLDAPTVMMDVRRIITRECYVPHTWADVVGADGPTARAEAEWCLPRGKPAMWAAQRLSAQARIRCSGAPDAPDLDWDEWNWRALTVAYNAIQHEISLLTAA